MKYSEGSIPEVDFRAFEATPGMSIIVRSDPPFFTVAALSNSFIAATGLTRKDSVGRQYFDLFPKRAGAVQQNAERNLRDSFEYVIRCRTPHEIPVQKCIMPAKDDLTFKYWRINNAPILDDLGQVIYIIQSISDVTEVVETKQKLATTGGIREGYRFFMDAPVIIGYVRGDEYVIEFANDGLLTVWGKTREVVGKSLLGVFPELLEQGIKDLLDQVRRTGKPFFAYEHPLKFNRDGKKETRYFDFVYKPFYENGDEQIASGVISVGHDVTAQVQARHLFKNVIEQAKDPILILKGPDMVLEVANDALLKLWNIDKSSIGKTFLELLPEMKDQGFMELLKKVYSTGEVFHGYEIPAVFEGSKGEKRTVYFNFTYQPFREPDGEISGVLVFASDATHQVLAKKAIEKGQLKWKNLANSMPATVWIASPDGSITFFNDRWYELTGLTAEESLGFGWVSALHPDDVDRCLNIWREAQANARSFEVEVRYRNKGGDYRWVIARGVPIKQEDQLIDWYGTITDIHQQKQFGLNLEEKVRERTTELEVKNKLLDNILKHSSNGIAVSEMVFDRWGNVRDAFTVLANDSAVKYSGIPRDLYLTRPATEFDPNIISSPYGQACLNTLRTGEPAVMQYFVEFSSRWLELTISKMDESHLIHIFTDVTAIKEAHLQLERSLEDLRYANRNLEEFAYAASHDLKEPLRKMQMFSDRLKEQLNDQLNDEQCRLFNRLESAAIRMQTLIDDLLEYSQAAKGSSKLEEVDLNETIKNVAEDLELEIQKKHACLDVQPLPTIKVDKRQIQQLFQNLISNALKYSRPDVIPFIKITSRVVRGKEVMKDLPMETKEKIFHLIEISDNGIGFDQKYADSIFDVFTRLESASQSRGSGIGLAIVKRVVESHHGSVWAESQPGKGSTFKLLLPAS